jgi:hypothetical protein
MIGMVIALVVVAYYFNYCHRSGENLACRL